MPITCQCPKPCQIHPQTARTGHVAEPGRPELVTSSTPSIDTADQLQFKKLENEFLKAQLRQRDAGQQVQAAQQQLQMFGAVLFEKAGIKPDEWAINSESATFVPHPHPAQKG